MKQYKIRMPAEIPEATSAAMTSWIEEALEKGGRLAPDPGPGPAKLTFALDSEKLIELANKKRERPHVILRRLVATHVVLPETPKEEKESAGAVAAELIPDKILPAKLSYSAEDLLPIVKTLDSGMTMAYRRLYGLNDLEAAKTPEADRELASAMAECCNRRSPAWLLANADLVKLTITSVRWGFAQTEALEKATEEARSRAKSNGHSAAPPIIAEETNRPEKPASAESPASAELHEHLQQEVQQEGDF